MIFASLQFQSVVFVENAIPAEKRGLRFLLLKYNHGRPNTNKKGRKSIRDLLKRAPPIERKPDGSLYRMTPAQRKRANALIRRECCNYDGGNCLMLDDGEETVCVQSISYSVNCKWFRRFVLLGDAALEAEIFQSGGVKRCAVCGAAFVPKSNRAKYCGKCAKAVHRKQKNASERKRRSDMDK
jgi:hypothetical protein